MPFCQIANPGRAGFRPRKWRKLAGDHPPGGEAPRPGSAPRRASRRDLEGLEVDVLMVGSGFAGAATAYHLSRAFPGTVLVLDQEEVPGAHASGRNAALVLQSVADPEVRRTVTASREAYEDRLEEVGFTRCGSLLLGSRSTLEGVRGPEVESRWRRPEAVRRAFPALARHHPEAALETPSDGVMDIWRLLQFYVRGARERGALFRFATRVEAISGPAPFRVATDRGTVVAGIVVNAAGAWAGRVGRLAGAASLPLVPYKRHLFVLDNAPVPPPGAPFVWDLDVGFYFRRESDALLFCICDEETGEGLAESVSPGMEERAAHLASNHLCGLEAARQQRVWSCFRTKAPDGRFVIGWDPHLEGLFWVAGLGGHGMGASWEVGALAAAFLRYPEVGRGHPFRPHRFAS